MQKDTAASLIGPDQLTQSQREAVFHKDGPLQVLAGPGSGKTRVITSRVAALIDSGVSPYHICAITFTNKAAEEMRDRIAMAGIPGGVHISTFHSLCVQILRLYGHAAGIRSNFSIYDDSDQKRCMKQAIGACDMDTTNFTPARMLGAVSKLKNDLEDPESVQGRASDYFTKALGQVYAHYQDILRENNALDFDDLLVQTAYLLRDFPDIRESLSNRFRYLLVDEYQDTNHAQYQIAKGLAMAHRNICVTGDPDQSIYRWRGADITNILAFEKDWPDAVVVKLEENFRSTPNILSIADKLIAANRNRKPKKLIPTRPEGADVEIEAHTDEKYEAVETALKIQNLIADGKDPNEIAVFYRVNSMSRAVEEAFIQNQIPYQVVRGVEFYNRKEIRDMLSYLKLLANPQDDVAFLRAVGTHPRGIGKTTLEKLGRFAKKNGQGFFEAIGRIQQAEGIGAAAKKKLAAFKVVLDRMKDDTAGSVAQLMERVFTETGYQDYLRKGGEKDEAALENVEELINSAAKYDQQAEAPGLTDFLQTIALYSDADAFDPGSGRVALMTLHAAKGLEFDHVFIMGLEDGLLPHERSMASDEEMEEERRLFFVGITRARRTLSVSHARHRVVHGQFMRTVPSQFLFEIGYDVQREDEFEPFDFSNEPQKKIPSPKPKSRQGQFQIQDRVEHPKFGRGIVKEYMDLGDNSIVVVRFQNGKTKSLMLKYAKLNRV